MIPVCVPVGGFISFGRDAVDSEVAGGIVVEAANDIEEGCLSGAGRSENTDKIAVRKIKGDVF